MILDYKVFDVLHELVEYVNEEELTKLDIQEIRETDNVWILLYWRVK